ncbi:MAG: hypothetical protein HYW77_02110 [Parcubacteria group bacterium]|nr:hypothetical protein [Parcubacteria group bacterium]
MKKITLLFAILLIHFFTLEKIAQAQSSNKFSIDVSGGYNRFPGSLFNFDKSVTKHPNHLSGHIKELGISYALDQKWSLSIGLFQINSSGQGEWSREGAEEELAKEDIVGTISGSTKMRTKGFHFNAKRYFTNGNLRPYLKFGLGLGWSSIEFNGFLRGHETESGFNFPILEPANDSVQRKIPVINLESGVEYKFKNNLSLIASGYWNTGFGAKVGLKINF